MMKRNSLFIRSLSNTQQGLCLLQKAQPFLLNNSIINLFVIKQILLIITLLNLDVMKSTTHLSLPLLIAILLIAVSCDKSEDELKDSSPFTIKKENYTIVKNSVISQEANNNRSESYSAPFEIENVERIENLLYINVSFQAGCSTNDFEIIWNGKIMESYPVLTRIFVKRTINNCIYIDAIDRLTLVVDLEELAEKNGNNQILEAIITVSNASKKQNSVNADHPVSSN